MPVKMSDRPTADLVILFLAGLVGIVVLGMLTFIVLVSVYNPEVKITDLAIRIAAITNTLTGAVVGYVAGRGVNGVKSNGSR